MAQKTKSAARASVKSKTRAGKTKPAAKPSVAKAAKVKAKAPAPVKTRAKPPALPKPAVPPEQAHVSGIARAKSALKRQKPSAAVAPAADATPKSERTRARKITIEINPNEAASALAAKWSTLFKRAEQIEAKPYNMTAAFEERTAIVHKVLGWGYILTNRNDRLEVLFKDGIKYLISNYKP